MNLKSVMNFNQDKNFVVFIINFKVSRLINSILCKKNTKKQFQNFETKNLSFDTRVDYRSFNCPFA